MLEYLYVEAKRAKGQIQELRMFCVEGVNYSVYGEIPKLLANLLHWSGKAGLKEIVEIAHKYNYVFRY